MRLTLALFGISLLTLMAHADAVYTCADSRGDSFIIKMANDGKRLTLRSLYQSMTFAQSKRLSTKSDFVNFGGRYPTGSGYAVGIIGVEGTLVRGETGTSDVVGAVKMDGFNYDCKKGEGKLTVSKATRREFSPQQSRREPCKLTSYYAGMTFMPPRVVCNYGGGVISITGTGGLF